MSEKVQYEVRDQVGWVTLNRPEILNAIDAEVLHSLIDIVGQAAADDDVRVLVWTGQGRAFSVGGDIKDMQNLDAKSFRPKAHLYQVLAQVCRDLDKPILAAINGYALGGGLELALMCDMRIAAESALLGVPDAVLGFSPTGGMTYLLPRIVGMGRALHLSFVPDPIDAQESERYGLVTEVVADEQLLPHVAEMAQRMVTFPAHGLMYMKRAFSMASESTFAASLKVEEEYDVACFFNEETQAALKAFLASRAKKR
jgi:enoyl-CoA hydratase/carnithine racemase